MIAAAPPGPPGKTGQGGKVQLPQKPPPNLKGLNYSAVAVAAAAAAAANHLAFGAGATPIQQQQAAAASAGLQQAATAAGLGQVPIFIGSGGVGASQGIALTQGQRYSLTVKATGGGPLPASFQGQTQASIQAQLNAASIAATVVSVKYSPDGTTLFIEEDHCGPSSATANPNSSGGVTTSYAPMGPGACGAAGWSTTKKAVVFGGGAVVLAAVVAAGTKAAGLW